VENLFAAGEVACTGLHGANRLASNSLLEGLVFGARAADAMVAPAQSPNLFATIVVPVERSEGAADAVPEVAAVRDLVWTHAGLLRTRADLAGAMSRLGAWRAAVCRARQASPADAALRRIERLVTVGFLITHAALRREESRGGHFRADFPRRDDLHWQAHFSDALRA